MVLLATPRRAVVGWAAGWGVVIMAGSVAWMCAIAPDWIEHWRQNLRAFTASGLAEASGLNPYAYQMIHLEPWLHRWWPDGIGPSPTIRMVGALLPAAVWLGVTATLALTARATDDSTPCVREDARRFTALALATVLTLLMAYHRTYDAVLMVLPGAWAWRALALNRRDATAWAVLAGVMLFTVPGPVALEVWGRGEGLASWLRETWVWRVVLLPHHNLALIAIAVLLTGRLMTAQSGRNEKSGRTVSSKSD